MQNSIMTKKSEEQEYEATPLGSICGTIDGLIRKGGASKEELMALRQSVEEVRADVDSDEEPEQEDVSEPMNQGKPGGVMIAIGFKKSKGEK